MSNSTDTAAPLGTSQEDIKWVFLDEDLADVIQGYGSIYEMHAAPLRLKGATAAKFADAKQRRVARSATPLSLD